jgi:GNAT superfamily N-acetyltransferase
MCSTPSRRWPCGGSDILRCAGPSAGEERLQSCNANLSHWGGAPRIPSGRVDARALSTETWDDFAALVEANNGVWGGCWCIGFHVEGLPPGRTVEGNRHAKLAHVMNGTAHQVLVYDGDECVGWCQYGPPPELPNINNRKRYEAGGTELPDWRIGCVFTGSKHRGQGVARVAVSAALNAIRDAGGGLVEAYPEQVEGRPPQRGAYFHTGPETLFTELGFTRDRQIAKWRWVMRLHVAPKS